MNLNMSMSAPRRPNNSFVQIENTRVQVFVIIVIVFRVIVVL